jgi:hypothetical protein
MSTLKPLKIDIVSDVVCPWCYIGKRRLEQAIALKPGIPVAVRYRPYFLNPWVPRGGMSREEYLTTKFGSVDRYKANAQRAARDGDYKFLKILDNTFLFNVVEDPMERANLKRRLPAVYDRLVDDWHAWNETMLPEIDESNTGGISGEQQADHPGATRPSGKADNPPRKKG